MTTIQIEQPITGTDFTSIADAVELVHDVAVRIAGPFPYDQIHVSVYGSTWSAHAIVYIPDDDDEETA